MKLEREKLSIDYARMETELIFIKEVIEQFHTVSTDVFTYEINDMNSMNSDFVKRYIKIVEFLCAQHISNLNDKLDKLYCLTTETIQEFKDKDEMLSRNRREKE